MVGGMDQQIKEIKEVIELDFKHPELFESLGITPLKGILLYGPPGTGKTLLARAVAHHTNCRFIRVSGTELVQKYIGEGSRMVREIFVMARKHAPCIIFIDEIDSIGSSRINGPSSGDSEVQRTMLELMNQLDGFESTRNIKVIMATNRFDILDPALLRPGRIDRHIEIPLPSVEARAHILRIHSRKMNMTRRINLRTIAEEMDGCSGADLKAVCTEAGMYALRERRGQITQEDFQLAIAKILNKNDDKEMSLVKSTSQANPRGPTPNNDAEYDLESNPKILAAEALKRYELYCSKDDLDAAVEFSRKAISTLRDNDTLLVVLNDLGNVLVTRYERTSEMADLTEAIKLARQTVESALHSNPHRAIFLTNLGGWLGQQYLRTGKRADLDEAIKVAMQAVRVAINRSNLAEALNNYGILLGYQYEWTDEMVDLKEAIKTLRHAVKLAPRAASLNNLAGSLAKWHEQTREMAVIEEVITITRQAVELTLHKPLDRAILLGNLGIWLVELHQQTGRMANLNDAIDAGREAVELMPRPHSRLGNMLNHLAVMLGERYRWTGEKADLEDAIEMVKHAIESTPHDHFKLISMFNNLGIMLELWHARTGEVADLGEAIKRARQTVNSLPHSHPWWARWLTGLGNDLERQHEWTGEMADLEEAIKIAREASDLLSHDHRQAAASCSSLGDRLYQRFKRTSKLADLEGRSEITEVFEIVRQAILLMPRDYPNSAERLNNITNKLQSWTERLYKITNVTEAIETIRQGLEDTLHDLPDQARMLNDLRNIFGYWSERASKMVDLEEAIKAMRQAVNSLPSDDINRAGYFANLGTMLRHRFSWTGKMVDLEEASSYLQCAWDCQNAIPFHRIQAAARCLKLLAIQRKVDTAIKLGKETIDLLPKVNTKLLSRSDQQFVLSTFAGVAADVCALLLESKQHADALKYLEMGRAVIIGQLVDARSDLSSLGKQHLDIVRRYERLRDEANTPVRRLEQYTAETQALTRCRRRPKAAAELDACIQEIRGIAGHERFLLGQTTAEMQECAAGGAIVVVNMTSFGSDAIIVSPKDIMTLNLPRLLELKARAWLDNKWMGRKERGQKNRDYLDYLSWLWEVCVSQIIDKVYEILDTANGLPRIWWIGSGLASTMPFHAAGIHSPGSTENAFSKVVSSYSPSIKALAYARDRAKATEGAQGSLLISTMPTTPFAPNLDTQEFSNLTGVIKETEQLKRIAGDRLPIELLDLPSVEQALDRLRDCYIAHFACHGLTDRRDPSKSGLILKGYNEGQTVQDRLTVERVSELNLRNARIAYLSACSTAENKAAQLSDEVIHIVSGFQVAGFPHVVGCLWPSIDEVCIRVASTFYKMLLRPGVTRWDGREIALAVREAVMTVRAVEMDMPLFWAQFVHYGA